MSDKVRARFWGRQLGAIDYQILQQASVCHVRLLDPGVVDAILRNDAVSAGSTNALAFAKLRTALMLHFAVQAKAIEQMGPTETMALSQLIRDKIRERLGDQYIERFGEPKAG